MDRLNIFRFPFPVSGPKKINGFSRFSHSPTYLFIPSFLFLFAFLYSLLDLGHLTLQLYKVSSVV